MISNTLAFKLNVARDFCYLMFQFSSVLSLDALGRREDMTDDSADSLFRSLLQEALVSRSGLGRDV